jgi:GT2 family glycosyltransferase
MIKKNFIEIKEKIIYGIKNPLLIIRGNLFDEFAEFIVEVDEIRIEALIDKVTDDVAFVLKVKIPSNFKEICVYVKSKSEKCLIFKQNNDYFKRIFLKLKVIFISISTKVGIIIKSIIRGFIAACFKYHFFIPIHIWIKYFQNLKEKLINSNKITFYNPNNRNEYLKWLKENTSNDKLKKLNYKPLISLIIIVDDTNPFYLNRCIESIRNQSYDNYEAYLIGNCSLKAETSQILNQSEKIDGKIKVIYSKKREKLSVLKNKGLKMSHGEFISFINGSDFISSDALYQVVNILNSNNNVDLIYSDEDMVDYKGKRCMPHFKPDYSPDTLLSFNYISHLAVLRNSVAKEYELSGKFDGAEEYDLFLKVVEKSKYIYHIPKILYHSRIIENKENEKEVSAIKENGRLAVEAALVRRKKSGAVTSVNDNNCYNITYIYKKEPKISIIVPTRDYAETLECCLKSIYKVTTYKNFEIIVVNNNSSEEETFKLFDEYGKKYNNFRVLDVNTEFNYSYINNYAVNEADGEYILLLNNDTKIITPNWLEIMVGYAMQSHIGAVGAKLLYPDTTIQHAGVILGYSGVAGHAYFGADRNYEGNFFRIKVPYNYAAVTAACLMIDKKKYKEINGLNEELKVAYNDVDFNIRLLEKGYYNIFLPQVELFHFESKSRGLDLSAEKYKRFMNESNYMHKKWDKIIKRDPYYNPNYSLIHAFYFDKKSKK